MRNSEYYFRESVSWGLISTGGASFRYYPKGFIHDVGGMSYFPYQDAYCLLAMLNTNLYGYLAKAVNPTVNLQIGDIANLPYGVGGEIKERMTDIAAEAVQIAKKDWDSLESSWGFLRHPLVQLSLDAGGGRCGVCLIFGKRSVWRIVGVCSRWKLRITKNC